MNPLYGFLTVLAWIIGGASTFTFLVKLYLGVREGVAMPGTVPTFFIAAACWAWIIAR
jgi:hypothetical protein